MNGGGKTADVKQFDFLRALREDVNFDNAVEEFERAVIGEALKRRKVIGDCGQALGIARSTLDAKRKKYGL